MKKTVFIITMLITGLSLRAADAAPASSYRVTLDFPYASKYVFRGVELAKQSLQPSVEIAVGSFTGGIWTNQPITDNLDNEIDFYGGFSIPLKAGWNLDTGVCIYYYPELNTGGGADSTTWEPYVGIVGSAGGFSPGVYLYYDATLKVVTYQGQVGYSIPLEPAGASLDFSANLGRVDPKSGSGYTYYGIGASVPFKFSEKGTFTLGVNYTHNNISGADRDAIFGTAGVTIGF
ncbi:MAG: TorF family putative porin [Opitutaceae bacterium]|nr:TorF family putative porin [Opitutaceae bacterium]